MQNKLIFIIIILLSLNCLIAEGDYPTASAVLDFEKSTNEPDDPAIWIHPTDRTKSFIATADKGSGEVVVYDLNGKIIQVIDCKGRSVNNIDVSYNFEMGKKKVDIIVANIRKIPLVKISKAALFIVNPDWDKKNPPLDMVLDAESKKNVISPNTYGMGLYRDPNTGKTYFFDATKDRPGRQKVKQFLISGKKKNKIKFTLVRELDYTGGAFEGLVVDDELGFVYVPEEGAGIHKFHAEEGKPTARISFFGTDDGFFGDREGSTLYKLNDGTGYYIVSDQGAGGAEASQIVIYEREGDNKLVKIVNTANKAGIGLELETDGLDVSSVGIDGIYPNGFLVVHNSGGQTYSLIDWADVAGDDLKVKPEMGIRE